MFLHGNRPPGFSLVAAGALDLRWGPQGPALEASAIPRMRSAAEAGKRKSGGAPGTGPESSLQAFSTCSVAPSHFTYKMKTLKYSKIHDRGHRVVSPKHGNCLSV